MTEELIVLEKPEDWPYPEDDYDEELILADDYRPRRRRRNPSRAQYATGGGLLIVVLAIAGWLLWYKSRNDRWPWEKTKTIFPTKVSQSLGSGFTHPEKSARKVGEVQPWRPDAKPTQQETDVSFIMP